MSRVASDRATKRSISSTIVSFFKKDKTGEEAWSVEETAPLSPELEPQPNDSDNSKMAELILYESEADTRPLLLPILPLQRLRMLRYKQHLRRLQYNLQEPFLRDFSGSPQLSPPPKKLQLQSLKVRKPAKALQKKSVLGKRWSGDLEYDLSEYDVIKKPKKASSLKTETPSIESPGLAHAILKRPGISSRHGSGDNLTENQLKLLSGKPMVSLVPKSNVKPTEVANIKDAETPRKLAALPSVGFDFVKNTENDSKLAAAAADSNASPSTSNKRKLTLSFEPTQSTGSNESQKVSFNLKADTPNQDATKPKATVPSFNFSAPKSDEIEAKPPAFSFGTSKISPNPTTLGDSKPLNDVKEKKPFSFSSSTKENSNDSKPSFTFGTSNLAENKQSAKKTTAEPGEKSEKKTPSFVFGKPSENATASTKPLSLPFGAAAQGDTQNGEPESISIGKNNETNSKPMDSESKATFAFDTKSTKNTSDDHTATNKPIKFNFANPSVATTNETKSQVSFSASDKSEPSETTNTKNTQAKPLFSFGNSGGVSETATSNPSLIFGAKDSSTKDSNEKPVFSFGAKESSSKDDSSKPIFAFGGSQPSNSSSDSKPAFSFGTTENKKDEGAKEAPSETKLSQPSSLTPAFSFGGTADKKEPTPVSFGAPSTTNQTSGAKTAETGFKFDTSGLKSNATASKPSFTFGANTSAPATANASSAAPAAKAPFTFGTSPSPAFGAPNPQQATSGFNFNFANGSQQPPANTGLFGSASTTSNNSPAFGSTTNNPPVNFNFGGGNTTASSTPPPFGNAPTPSFSGPNAQSRPFSPSHSVNLNFGGPASQTPSTIFGAGASAPPAQIFGGQPQNAMAGFGNQPQNAAQVFNGAAPAPGPQMPMQLPPGRKLARMRARRG
ncbi:LAFE_0E13278g1_1 [Lachancea fermentati]|uniref:LAFE_0E13278g1_1 n=1 Tax=Lachancea fermentati TaxID=4955 RepID=A0A1G4MDU3_LACFM|nr:LAFE_0E13278g1_1 [Lachancea fermentati]